VNVSTVQGKRPPEGVAIDLIGTLNAAAGDLDRIRRIVKLLVLSSIARRLLRSSIWSQTERPSCWFRPSAMPAHARGAFGVAQIPFGSCVEIDLIAGVNEK
jgi:hypothetical protein